MLSILEVTFDYPPDALWGAGWHVQTLARGLHGLGHTVRVLTKSRANADQYSAHLQIPDSITQKCLGSARPGEAFTRLEDILAWSAASAAWLGEAGSDTGFRPDVVHNHGWLTLPIATAAARTFGCPVVSTVHIVNKAYGALPGLWDRATPAWQRLEEELYETSTAIILPSYAARRAVEDCYPWAAAKTTVVPHGLDWSSTGTADIDQVASTDAAPTLLYAGRLSSERGVGEFLEAVITILDENPHVRVAIVGRGPLSDDLRLKYGQYRQIQFRGQLQRAELLRLMRDSYLLCNPALIETFGLGELEAMGAGTAVVSTAGRYKHSHVTHKLSGVVVPLAEEQSKVQLDVAELAHGMRVLVGDMELRDAYASEGARHARRCTVDHMAAQTAQLFERALN